MSDWIYDQLGLVVLKEDTRGALVPNGHARTALDGKQCPDIGTALHALLRGPIKRPQIASMLARARAGVQTEWAGLRGERVVVIPELPGRAMAIVSCAGTLDSAVASAATAELNAGVSHELANALGAIAGWARLAKQGRRVQEALDLIEMSADSAWAAAQHVLGHKKGKRELAHESIDLSSFVEEAARLLGPKAGAGDVLVRTAIEPGLFVRGDRGSAWSIVWNLAANAVEALPPGGTVELRLRGVGNTALLVVEDNGPGMSDDEQRRAFEPYFTTKSSGTGLGLVMVRQAVAAVGGSVELHSHPGRGARFSVSLPLANQKPGGTKRSSGVFYAEPIQRRILVVDDDLGLRELIATALSMRGAEVVAVDSAEAALQQQGPFAVAIVDLLLPDARGDALLAQLREAGLAEVGMLVTGTELPDELAPNGKPSVVLRKPFELEDLFESLAAALRLGDAEDRSATA